MSGLGLLHRHRERPRVLQPHSTCLLEDVPRLADTRSRSPDRSSAHCLPGYGLVQPDPRLVERMPCPGKRRSDPLHASRSKDVAHFFARQGGAGFRESVEDPEAGPIVRPVEFVVVRHAQPFIPVARLQAGPGSPDAIPQVPGGIPFARVRSATIVLIRDRMSPIRPAMGPCRNHVPADWRSTRMRRPDARNRNIAGTARQDRRRPDRQGFRDGSHRAGARWLGRQCRACRNRKLRHLPRAKTWPGRDLPRSESGHPSLPLRMGRCRHLIRSLERKVENSMVSRPRGMASRQCRCGQGTWTLPPWVSVPAIAAMRSKQWPKSAWSPCGRNWPS